MKNKDITSYSYSYIAPLSCQFLTVSQHWEVVRSSYQLRLQTELSDLEKSYFWSNKIIMVSWIENQQYQYFSWVLEWRGWSYKPLSTCHQQRISSKSWNSTVCFDNSVSALTGRKCQPIPIWNATRKNKACQNELERCLLRATCGEKQSQGEKEKGRVGERGREREGRGEIERERNCSCSTWLCPWDTRHAAPPTVGDSDRILSVQHSPSVWLMSLILPINGESPVDYHQIAVCNC